MDVANFKLLSSQSEGHPTPYEYDCCNESSGIWRGICFFAPNPLARRIDIYVERSTDRERTYVDWTALQRL
jgi:hypothetical protein